MTEYACPFSSNTIHEWRQAWGYLESPMEPFPTGYSCVHCLLHLSFDEAKVWAAEAKP